MRRESDGTIVRIQPYMPEVFHDVMKNIPRIAEAGAYGVIVEGSSALNTAALTGESLPRDVRSGDEVISGCPASGTILKPSRRSAIGTA